MKGRTLVGAFNGGLRRKWPDHHPASHSNLCDCPLVPPVALSSSPTQFHHKQGQVSTVSRFRSGIKISLRNHGSNDALYIVACRF